MSRARSLTLALPDVDVPGDLLLPDSPRGLVIFAHGSGSSRLSGRNRLVADQLRQRGLATLLFDLLTENEASDYGNRFDIPLLTRRLLDVTTLVREQALIPEGLPIGYFGASTGAAAALDAAADPGQDITAVVSRGGRPDLAHNLSRVRCPTLLIVGGNDPEVLELNRVAQTRLGGLAELSVVPRASHLFEEPGALERVAQLAGDWFALHCTGIEAGGSLTGRD